MRRTLSVLACSFAMGIVAMPSVAQASPSSSGSGRAVVGQALHALQEPDRGRCGEFETDGTIFMIDYLAAEVRIGGPAIAGPEAAECPTEVPA